VARQGSRQASFIVPSAVFAEQSPMCIGVHVLGVASLAAMCRR